ncbi:hypothetical protein [Paenibacillus sp. S-12]|uniref:hypothetical protein n=1 Tax=Paenibacillus sp. S-12 TaxID=3031371 RepID=UPI0025A0231D|nr:hypothetical protein [Paenibacillus sp. S-12]
MHHVVYRKQKAVAQLFIALICILFSAGLLTLAILDFKLTLSLRIALAAAACIGFAYCGSNLVVSLRALTARNNKILSYDDETIWNEYGLRAAWTDVADIRIEQGRVGILFIPVFPKFVVLFKDGSSKKVDNFHTLSDQEMIEWRMHMKRHQKSIQDNL